MRRSAAPNRRAGDRQRDRRGPGDAARLRRDHRARRRRSPPMFASTDDVHRHVRRAGTSASTTIEKAADGFMVHPSSSAKDCRRVLLRDRRPLRFGTAEEQTAAGGFISTYGRGSRGDRGGVLAWRADHGRRPRPSASSPSVRLRRTRSPRATSGCSAPSRRAWALPSRTRGCSTRRSVSWPRPTSARPSWRSSTAVQEGLAQNLEMQAMYDLVGDKIQEIFDAQVVDIGIFDIEDGIIRFPYTIERGERLPDEAIPIRSGAATAFLETGAPLLVIATRSGGSARRGNSCPGRSGRAAKSVLIAPMTVAGEVAGSSRSRISIGSMRSPSDVRLALDARRGAQRGPRERAPVRRDEAAPDRDRRARRRAGDHQQRPGGAGSPAARHAGDVRPGRRQDPGDLRRPGRRHRHPRRRREDGAFATRTRSSAACAFPDEPMSSAGHRSCARSSGPNARSSSTTSRPGAELTADVPVIQGEPARSSSSGAADRRRRGQGRDLAPEPRSQNAFSEADVRLLSTLAASLSVALENARLFDETKRLLTETDERAAELAIINSVQEGSPRTSTCRRCTTSSATRSRRSSTPRSSTSASSTARGDHSLPLRDRARHARTSPP